MDKKIKVFIVDDSIVARNMLKMLISIDESIEIVGEAGSGEGSIILLEDVNPDVILLETNIGGKMSIIQVVKEIRKVNETAKILLCADQAALHKVIAATDIGADDFISKPYKRTIILRTIHELIGE